MRRQSHRIVPNEADSVGRLSSPAEHHPVAEGQCAAGAGCRTEQYPREVGR